jgi:hypothetical protein
MNRRAFAQLWAAALAALGLGAREERPIVILNGCALPARDVELRIETAPQRRAKHTVTVRFDVPRWDEHRLVEDACIRREAAQVVVKLPGRDPFAIDGKVTWLENLGDSVGGGSFGFTGTGRRV